MQLQDYALGQMESKTNLGYVKRGCGTSEAYTYFSVIGKEGALFIALSITAICGVFFQIVFVWIVSAVLLKMSFKEYSPQGHFYHCCSVRGSNVWYHYRLIFWKLYK